MAQHYRREESPRHRGKNEIKPGEAHQKNSAKHPPIGRIVFTAACQAQAKTPVEETLCRQPDSNRQSHQLFSRLEFWAIPAVRRLLVPDPGRSKPVNRTIRRPAHGSDPPQWRETIIRARTGIGGRKEEQERQSEKKGGTGRWRQGAWKESKIWRMNLRVPGRVRKIMRTSYTNPPRSRQGVIILRPGFAQWTVPRSIGQPNEQVIFIPILSLSTCWGRMIAVLAPAFLKPCCRLFRVVCSNPSSADGIAPFFHYQYAVHDFYTLGNFMPVAACCSQRADRGSRRGITGGRARGLVETKGCGGGRTLGGDGLAEGREGTDELVHDFVEAGFFLVRVRVCLALGRK